MTRTSFRGFANRSTLLVLVAALAAGLGLFAAQKMLATTPANHADTAVDPSRLHGVRLLGKPRTLPAWQLAAADGSALTPASLRGHWTVVFLGFTHCPDVCPTTLTDLALAQKEWAALPVALRPRVLFVSADPERDTPAKTGEFARYFDADTLAASGTAAQVAQFAKAMGLVYMKVPLENGDYTIDHSATLVVLDPQGRQAGLVRAPLSAHDIAADLRLLSELAP